MNNEVVHKIGDAVLTEQATETLVYLQDHENESIDEYVCKLLKIGGYIARYSEMPQEVLKQIIILSEVSEILEGLKK